MSRLSMCRLYGLHANEPTRIECSLVRAQNALMEQSRKDLEGLTHGHGWGLAAYPDGVPFVEKQAWAAYHAEHFKKTAARIYSRSVIAHVRRATVGPPGIENTHPFVHGVWLFAHNGTVPNFDQVRECLIEELDPLHRTEIKGSTDSEHVFRYLLTLWEHEPERPLVETLRRGLERVIDWCREIDPNRRIGLNVLWTDGERMVGSRLNRSLWYLERAGLVRCEICGQTHVHHSPKQHHRGVEIASEPITNERWLQIPNGTVFSVDPDFRLNVVPFSAKALMSAEGVKTFEAQS
ncbi:MAG: class II glutamine amidotransferase [Methyloceanibacter sp.]